MNPMRLAFLACLLPLPAFAAPAAPAPDCQSAIAVAERGAATAPGLLAAIGVVESGRTDPRTGQRRPWPWTVTAEGTGTYYPSKSAAIAAVEALQARGMASVDVGCMQVNLLYHPAAFRSLDQAFDPTANAAYAGRFLAVLYARTGAWPAAAAAYHSLTPERGAAYAKLISAVWGGAPVITTRRADGVQVVTFPGGGEMRLFRDADAGPARGRVLGYLSSP